MPYDREEKGKKPEITIASLRNRYQTNIRREHLQQIFKSIRLSAQQSFLRNQSPPPPPPMQQQHMLPPLRPEFIQYLQQYLVKYGAPQIYQQNLPALPGPVPIEEPRVFSSIKPPIEDDIYFQKENFRIYKRLIGEGTFSKVWEGVNLLTNQKIAAKQIKKLQDHESKCLKTLSSPFIVKIHAILRHKNYSFIILEHCQRNLREELDNCNYQLPVVLKYFEQVLEGMNVLQSRNFIHRDLKFQNILICNGTVKIADFGLAKCIGDQLQVQSRRCGTPYTMAPQIYFSREYRTPYSVKCDIWSFGVILHEMLYQKHPFGFNQSDFKRKKRVSIKKRFGILDQLIEKCLIFKPQKRISWEGVLQIYRSYRKAKDRFMDIEFFPIQSQSFVYNDPHHEMVRREQNKKEEIIALEGIRQEKERQLKYVNDYNAQIVQKKSTPKRESKEGKDSSSLLRQDIMKIKKKHEEMPYLNEPNMKRHNNSRDPTHLQPSQYEPNLIPHSSRNDPKRHLFANYRKKMEKQNQFHLRNQVKEDSQSQGKPEKEKTEVGTVKREVYFLQSPKRDEIKRGRIMGEAAVIFFSIIFICVFICF